MIAGLLVLAASDTRSSMVVATILFVTAALIGASLLLAGRRLPAAVTWAHGTVVAGGLLTLATAAVAAQDPRPPLLSFAVFTLVALFGYMLVRARRKRASMPHGMAAAHGVLALIALSFHAFVVLPST